jgi:putative endopeptidase
MSTRSSFRSFSVLFALLPAFAMACGAGTPAPAGPSATGAAKPDPTAQASAAVNTPALPKASAMSGLSKEEETALDRSVSPCDNFFQFSCGGWMKLQRDS